MKNEYKIRKWLGNRYHLNVSLSGNHLENVEWRLFRKYDGWINDGSKAIMTNETHSEEELYKFAKKHRQFDEGKCMIRIIQINAFLAMILSIINIYFNSEKLKIFFFGMEFVIITTAISMFFIYNYNLKVDKLELKELFKKLEEKCEKNE